MDKKQIIEKKVGDILKSKDGTDYVVARIWEWPKWNDLDLFNKKTGERGYFRELKNNK